MKTKIKRHSRSVISVILAVCMLVSCMMVGLIATDAARVMDDEAVGEDWNNYCMIGDAMGWSKRTSDYHSMGSSVTYDCSAYIGQDMYFRVLGDNTELGVDGSPSVTINQWHKLVRDTDKSAKRTVTKGLLTFKVTNENEDGQVYVTADADPVYKLYQSGGTAIATFTHADSIKTFTATSGTLTAGTTYQLYLGNDYTTYKSETSGTLTTSAGVTLKKGESNMISFTPSVTAPYIFTWEMSATRGTYEGTLSVEVSTATVTPGVSPAGAGTAEISQTQGSGYSSSAISGLIPNSTIYARATANTYYEFAEWETASGLAYTDATQSSEQAVTVYASANATAKFRKINYNLTAGTFDHGSLTVPAQARWDSTITPVITPEKGYKVSRTYYVEEGSSTEHAFTDSFTMPKANVTVYAEMTTATAYTVTFAPNTPGFGEVTAMESDGTLVTNGGSVYEGTEVTFTASPSSGYVFTGWTGDLTGSTVIQSKTISANTSVTANFAKEAYRFISGADGNTYSKKMVELSDGLYITKETYTGGYYFQILRDADGKVTQASSNTTLTANKKTSVNSWGAKSTTNTNGYTGSNVYILPRGTYYVVYDSINDQVYCTTDSKGHYPVTVYITNGSIRYYNDSWQGTSLFGSSTVTSDPAATTVSGYNSWVQKVELSAAQVSSGKEITIKTTCNTGAGAGYYVMGFDVNGGLTQAVIHQEFNDNGTAKWNNAKIPESGQANNEFTLTVKDYPDDVIVVTPIYAPKVANSSKVVRFYAYDFTGDVYDKWDGRLAVYPYIDGGAEPFSCYPGQLMVNEGGAYYIDIPATDSSNNPIQGLTMNNYTWDDFYWDKILDSIHDETRIMTNRQTYDYNEFEIINKIFQQRVDEGTYKGESIIFTFKYKETKTLDDSNLGRSTYYVDSTSSQNTTLDYRTTYGTIPVSDAQYQWENLTDYYKNRVDIFGSQVDEESNAEKKAYHPIRIVSNGYDHNTVGYYATAWALYKPVDASGNDAFDPDTTVDHYKLFEVIGGQGILPPTHESESYLIDSTYADNIRCKYDAAYRAQRVIEQGSDTGLSRFVFDCARIPVEITYEYEGQSMHPNEVVDSGADTSKGYRNAAGDSAGDQQNTKYNWGNRSDGRWYYSNSDQLLKANTLIEISDKKNGPFVRDYYQANSIDYTKAGYSPSDNTGLISGSHAYFANEDLVTKGSESYQNVNGDTQAYALSDNKCYFKLKATEDIDGNYTFEGWYLKNDDKYTLITHDKEYDVLAKTNDVFVARFYKTPGGAVKISHDLLASSGGSAATLNSVSIVASDTTTVVDTISTSNANVTTVKPKYIKSDSTNYIKIVIDTTPNSGWDFNKFWYDYSKATDSDPADVTELTDRTADLSNLESANSINVSVVDNQATILVPVKYFFMDDPDISGTKMFNPDKEQLRFFSDLESAAIYSVTITKDIDNDLNSDWGDYTNFFPIKISVSHDNGTTFTQINTNLPCVDYQGNKNTNIDNCIPYGSERVHAIRQGDKLTLSGLAATDQVRVEELRTNPFEEGTDANSNFNSKFAVALSNYTYNSITAQTQATPPVAVAHEGEGGTHFETFIVGTHNLDITVTNEVQMVSLDVQKLFSDFNYADESTFDFIVTYKPLGANSQSYLPLKTGTAQNSAVTATATGKDQNIYTVKKTGKIRFADIPKGSRISVNEPQSSIGVSNVTNGQRFAYDHAALASSPTSHIDNGDDFTVVADDTLTVYNKVKKNEVDITKAITIPDHSDTDTVHTIEVTVCENGNEADSVPLNQLEYKLNERYRLDGSTPATVTPTSVPCVDGKATITLKAQQNLYFLYPVGSKFTVKEVDNSATNSYTLTNVTVSNAAATPAPSAQGSNPFTFYTDDKMATLTITNSKIYNYTINYTYPSRYNNLTNEKLYGDQTYTVTGSINSADENFSTYIDYEHETVNQALVKAKNPFESDFMYSFEWDYDNITYNPNSTKYTADVGTTNPTTQNVSVTFEFPYTQYTNCKNNAWGGYYIYGPTEENPANAGAYMSPAAISVGYQKVPCATETYTYTDEHGEEKTGIRYHCTTAAAQCGDKNFLYWSIREKAIASDEWVEVARCYTQEYTYAAFNDYHVRPIYEDDAGADTTEESNTSLASIKFLDTSRNQWNNGQKGTKSTPYAGQDMVYADFDVAYRYKGQPINGNSALKAGVLIENLGTINQDYLLDHRNTTTTDGKAAYNASLAYYQDTNNYAYNAEAVKTYIRAIVHSGTAPAEAQTAYQTTLDKEYTLNLKQRGNDQTTTNMNRVEYYHGSTVRSIAGSATNKVNGWDINAANTNGVFRAYAYIVDSEGTVTLSEPTYYTLYGTASLDHLMTE